MRINLVVLGGRAGRDAELRYSADGKPQMKFSLAVNGWKKDVPPTWFDVVMFGPRTEKLAELITKGRELIVQGEMSSRKWQNKEGATITSWEVIAQDVQLLGGGERTEMRTTRTEEAGDDLPWD